MTSEYFSDTSRSEKLDVTDDLGYHDRMYRESKERHSDLLLEYNHINSILEFFKNNKVSILKLNY